MKYLLFFMLTVRCFAQTELWDFGFQAANLSAFVSSNITFDTIATNIDTSAESPETFTHTISTLANGYIVVHLSYLDADTVTGVTYDGSAMAALQRATNSSDTTLKAELWGLAVGSKTAGGYTVSIAGIGTGVVNAFSTSWNGVHQTTSTGTANSGQGVDTAPTVTITSAASELVIDVVSHYFTADPTVGAGQTERGNESVSSQIGGATSSEAGAASVVMSWTLGGSTQWVIAGVPLKPAS